MISKFRFFYLLGRPVDQKDGNPTETKNIKSNEDVLLYMCGTPAFDPPSELLFCCFFYNVMLFNSATRTVLNGQNRLEWIKRKKSTPTVSARAQKIEQNRNMVLFKNHQHD